MVRGSALSSSAALVRSQMELHVCAGEALRSRARHWIVGAGDNSHTLVQNTSLRASRSGDGLLNLLGDASALLRACIAIDLDISPDAAEGKLGIVDSLFEPSLDASVMSIGPPDCGVQLAQQWLCDPRANCTRRASGGVECSCRGNGKRAKGGGRDDGSSCEQSRSLAAHLVTPELRFVVRKPGKSTNNFTLQLVAGGDEAFSASMSANHTLRQQASLNTWSILASSSGLFDASFG
jgi:hypothetical protein